MSNWLEVTLRFRLASGLHITGERARLGVDKGLVVDWYDGQTPLVPATSIKGWLRAGAERALRGLGAQVCDGSSPSTLCGICPICRVFGHPRGRSPLRFENVKLEGASRQEKVSVSLSRRRRTAYEERLFSTEVAWHKVLETRIQGALGTQEEAQQAAAVLWLAARMGYTVGAAGSRGLGWLEWDHFGATVDGQPVSAAVFPEILRVLVAQTKGGVA